MTQGLVRHHHTGGLLFLTRSCHPRRPHPASSQHKAIFEHSLAAENLRNPNKRNCAVASPQSIFGGGVSMVGYIYDAEGSRVAKGTINTLSCDITRNGFTTTNSYVVGQDGEQVSETDGSGQWLHSNVYVQGQLLATYDDQGVHFQITDWLGNRRVQTDYLGRVQATWQNLPFGEFNPSHIAPPTGATEQHFTGKERDAESGLDYFGARYYASSMGRFMSPDDFGGHLEDPQTLNRYAYVRNNPLRYTDPTGHDLQESCTQSKDNKSTCGGRGHNKHVGTTDKKGHFHVTHFQTDKNGNLSGHSVSFNTNGIHIDGNNAQFIAGTDPTRVNGEAGTSWADTHFVAVDNCGGTCEARGTLFFGKPMSQSDLANFNLKGPNVGLDSLGDHPGLQFRGGNVEGPDMHLSFGAGQPFDPMHFDNRYPYGSASGFLDHAAGWLNPAGHSKDPQPIDISPVPQP